MKKHLIHTLAAFTLGALTLLAPGRAEAKFTFPTNHPDLEWYSIETEHFNVHYPVSRRSAEEGNDHYLTAKTSAGIVARVAEEMWPRECAAYNYYLKERVDIVLLNQTDDLEGFTVPTFDWIEISLNPGSYFYRQRGRAEWFSDVLAHEFGHVISLKLNAVHSEAAYGLSVGGLYSDGVHDVDTGVEFFIGDNDSFYFSEGSSEGASDNAAFNWWTSARDMNLRMSVLEGRMLSYEQWNLVTSPYGWNDWERNYQMGYSFNLYLRGRFGDDVFIKAAQAAGKRWELDWTTVWEEVTGVPIRTLYNDYIAYLTDHYNKQAAGIRNQGEVAGMELLDAKPDWVFTKPSERDAWNEKTYLDRWKAREATGTWMIEPRFDAASGVFGINTYGAITVSKYPIDEAVAFGGLYPMNPATMETAALFSDAISTNSGFMDAWDFIPGQNAVVITASEHFLRSRAAQVLDTNANPDGYNWNQLAVVDLVTREDKKHGVKFDTWARKKTVLGKHELFAENQARLIPNTFRASAPAVSPDGTRVAFLEYTDGTVNLATINLDGSDKRLLTNYNDGTWMQSPEWSPDSTKVVIPIFKNYQQNLYVFNADGSGVQALTWDAWEELDPYWAPDGRILFSADPIGVNNIFALDLATKKVTQITNVLGGAECPILTPEGNLVYNYYSAFGWKTYGLRKSDFYNKDATAYFGVNPDPAAVQASLAFSEDLSSWDAKTTPYKWTKSLMPAFAIPMLRVGNDSMTNVSAEAGFYAEMMDYVEKHSGMLYFMLGEDYRFQGSYTNQMWYPNITIGALSGSVKYDYGYLIDPDNNPETDNDSVMEGKNQQIYNYVFAFLDYPWSDTYTTGLAVYGSDWGFMTPSENVYTPYSRGVEVDANVTYANGRSYTTVPNPSGRFLTLDLVHGYTDVVYKAYNGAMSDDGQILDNYGYNRAEFRWTENIDMPSLGNGILAKAKEKGHRIQIDTRLGYIDRNVAYNDEFRAGGQHPYYWGANAMQPNTQFAGYPGYSLLGETMGMLNIAYRFPIERKISKRVGPLFLSSAYCQIGATAGNLWSFRPPEAEDTDLYYLNAFEERVAYNPDDIKREIPFVDEAYKNGNYMLYDAAVELRLASLIFNTSSWDSFVRFAYGFNAIRGIGDVDGDDITDATQSGLDDQLSSEQQPAGLRVYIGLGTGW